jgi:DNA-binding response OmpR family regulator
VVAKPKLLVVGQSEETSVVLREALSNRVAEVLSARGVPRGLALARSQSPALVVVDLDCKPAQTATIAEDFRSAQVMNAGSVVFLGAARQEKACDATTEQGTAFVRKPYHFGPLIRKIEELLAHCEQTSVRRAA